MKVTGLYRVKSLPGIPNGVMVTDGEREFEISEPDYVARGGEPDVRNLEWQHPKETFVRFRSSLTPSEE